jgi:F0F1-type ATP synthase membrane subunit b/b'
MIEKYRSEKRKKDNQVKIIIGVVIAFMILAFIVMQFVAKFVIN